MCDTLNEYYQLFVTLVDELSDFDILLDFSYCNLLYNWSIPSIVESNKQLVITKGRNPITEILCDNYISNDTCIGDVPIQILTGPNCSGKSVYIRQVGMIVFLALIGSGVPAEYSEIPLFKRICTRMTTKESSSNGLSAFTIDCNQMSYALRNCNQDSLLLIDEFGKGTHPDDGYALCCATLRYLISFGNKGPKTIFATHFLQVFKELEEESYVPIRMEIIIQNENAIKFLYKLNKGITTSSYGIQCAQIAGIDSDVIKRSREISNCFLNNESVTPLTKKIDVDKYYNFLLKKFVTLQLDDTNLNDFMSIIKKVSNRLNELTN